MMMNEPLFDSAHNALLFAFNFSAQQYDRPLMNRLADDPVGYVSKGLSGMDGAAQAGMIFNKLFHLPPLYQYIVFASYAPRTISCSCRYPCCSGTKRNVLWEACITEIEQTALRHALTGCVSHRVLRRGIVARAFGDKSITLAALAEKTGVSETTANSHNQKVRQWLLGVPATKRQVAEPGEKAKAQAMIKKILMEDGLVRS